MPPKRKADAVEVDDFEIKVIVKSKKVKTDKKPSVEPTTKTTKPSGKNKRVPQPVAESSKAAARAKKTLPKAAPTLPKAAVQAPFKVEAPAPFDFRVEAPAPAKAPAKAPVPAPPKGPSHWSEIVLEGEERGDVRIYDDCNDVRRKIRALQQKEPGFKITNWLKEIGGINNNSYQRFMKASGPAGGAENGTYYAAYCYFEKVRILNKKPKSAKRKKMEESQYGHMGVFTGI